MKGIIVRNGYFCSKAYDEQILRLTEEFQKAGVETDIYFNKFPVTTCQKFNYDFCVFLDKDINLAKVIEKSGVKIFNNPKAIYISDSKIRTSIALAELCDVKLQKAVFSPKKYFYETDKDFLLEASEILGYPMVIKDAYGSRGEQVFMVENFSELCEIDKLMGTNEYLLEEYRHTSKGKSVRIIVVGGRVLGGMVLENENNFRSNSYLGGKGKVFNVPVEYELVSQTVARTLNLDYCGVDLFYDEPVVIEVNSNAYFAEFEETTGINVALNYVQHILENVYD